LNHQSNKLAISGQQLRLHYPRWDKRRVQRRKGERKKKLYPENKGGLLNKWDPLLSQRNILRGRILSFTSGKRAKVREWGGTTEKELPERRVPFRHSGKLVLRLPKLEGRGEKKR